MKKLLSNGVLNGVNGGIIRLWLFDNLGNLLPEGERKYEVVNKVTKKVLGTFSVLEDAIDCAKSNGVSTALFVKM